MTGGTPPEGIGAALEGVRADIARFAERHGRTPDSVRLLAVAKTRPATAIEAALAAGQHAFGENYVDEALGKMDALAGRDLEWHFIGTLQSRRCRAVAERFDWAHGVDREKVARRLAEARGADAPPLNVCIQVDVDEEASKGGVAPDEVGPLAELCASLPRLRLRGLMAIPAPREDLDGQRRAFAVVRERFERLRANGHDTLDTLSMGMSGDLEAAIAEGATLVRVGTAIFGERERRASASEPAA